MGVRGHGYVTAAYLQGVAIDTQAHQSLVRRGRVEVQRQGAEGLIIEPGKFRDAEQRQGHKGAKGISRQLDSTSVVNIQKSKLFVRRDENNLIIRADRARGYCGDKIALEPFDLGNLIIAKDFWQILAILSGLNGDDIILRRRL